MDALSVKLWMRNNPALFSWRWKRLEREGLTRRVVRPGDDAVIEGFPRSANTYATYAFMHAQGRSLRLGNHFHSPAQFKLAARYGVPALLVLRRPVDAVLSLVLYENGLTPEEGFRMYDSFHRPLIGLRDSLVVARFEKVIADFNPSIVAMNEKFGTAFATLSDGDDETVKQLIADERSRKLATVSGFKRHALQSTLPSAEKELAKQKTREALDSPHLSGVRQRAEDSYAALAG